MTSRGAAATEKAIVFFVFLMYSYCLNYSLPNRFETPLLLGFLQKSSKLLAAFLVLLYLIKNPRLFFRTAIQSKIVIVLFVYCASSIVWSPVPMVTLKEVILLGLAIGFSIYLACNFNLNQVLLFVVGCNLLGALLSLVMWLLYPQEAWSSFTIGNDRNLVFGFRGSYVHKNLLGLAMNVSLLGTFFVWRTRQISALLGLPLVFLYIILLFFSRSVANYLGVVIAFGLAGLSFLFSAVGPSNRKAVLIALMLILGVCFFAGLFGYGTLSQKLNRTTNLSGRLPIWKASLAAAKNRPWFGYGFNSFWPSQKDLGGFPDAVSIWRDVKWATPNAHNGYLDMLLGTGMVGVFLSVLLIASLGWKLVKRLLDSRLHSSDLDSVLFGLIFLFLMAYINCVESFLFNTRFIYLLILLYITYTVGLSACAKRIPTTLFFGGDTDTKLIQ